MALRILIFKIFNVFFFSGDIFSLHSEFDSYFCTNITFFRTKVTKKVITASFFLLYILADLKVNRES